jgi:hypothetical protein
MLLFSLLFPYGDFILVNFKIVLTFISKRILYVFDGIPDVILPNPQNLSILNSHIKYNNNINFTSRTYSGPLNN